MTKKIFNCGILITFIIACGLIFTACSCGRTPPPPGDGAQGNINGIVIEVNNQSLVFNAETNTINVEYGIADTISWETDLKVYSTFEEVDIQRQEIDYKTSDGAEGWTLTTDIPVASIIPVSTYSLKVKYCEFEKNLTLNVVKGKVKVPTLEQSEFEYTGNQIVPVILNQTALIQESNSMQSTYSAKNVDEYAFYFDLADKLNYEWDIESGDKSATQVVTWKIKKKVLSIPEIAKTNEDFVQNGNVAEFTYKYAINNSIVSSIAQGFALNAEQSELFVLENATQSNASASLLKAKLKIKDTRNYTFPNDESEIELAYKINKKQMQKPQRVNNNVFTYDNGAVCIPELNQAYIPEIMTGLVGSTNPKFEIKNGQINYLDIENNITFKPEHANNFAWEGESGDSVQILFQIHRAEFILPQDISSSLNAIVDYSYGLKLQDINIYDFVNRTSDLSNESVNYLKQHYLIPADDQQPWNNITEFSWSNSGTVLNVGENQLFEFKYSRDYRFYNEAVANIAVKVNKIQVDLSNVEWSGPSENELVYSLTLNPIFTLTNLPNGITVENGGYSYFYSATEQGEYLETTSKNKAGYYKVVAELTYSTNNFELLNWTQEKATHFYVVQKAQISLSNVNLEKSTFEYDAKAKDIKLVNLPNGVTASTPQLKFSSSKVGEYSACDYAVEIGFYVVMFELTFDTENCIFNDLPNFIDGNVATIEFEITKGRINLDNIEWSNSVFIVNGEYKTITVVSTSLPSGVTVSGYSHFVKVNGDYQSTSNLGDVGEYKTNAELVFDTNKYLLYLNGEPCTENVATHEWKIIESVISMVYFGDTMISEEYFLSVRYMEQGKLLSIEVDEGFYLVVNGVIGSSFVFNDENKNSDLILQIFADGAQDGDLPMYEQVIKCFDVQSIFETLTLNGEDYNLPEGDMISFGYGDRLQIDVKDEYVLTINEIDGVNSQFISGNSIDYGKYNYNKTYKIEINLYGVLGVQKIDKTISCVMVNSVKIYGNDYGVNLNNNEVKVDLELNATSVEVILNLDEFTKNVNNLSYVLIGNENQSGIFTSNILNVDVTKYNKLSIKFSFAQDDIIELFSIEFMEFSPIETIEVEYFMPSIYGFTKNAENLTRADGQYDYEFGVHETQKINIVSAVNVALKAKYASDYTVQLLLSNGEEVDFTKLGSKIIHINILDGENQIVQQDTLFINFVLVLNVKGTGEVIIQKENGEFEVEISSESIELEHNPRYDTPITNYATIVLNDGEEIDLTQDGQIPVSIYFAYNIDNKVYSITSMLNINKVASQAEEW